MPPLQSALSDTRSSQPDPRAAENVVGRARECLAALDPALDPRSQRGKMALLLIVAATAGCNIDRLSRLTGIEREAAAKFSRRLFDAGVEPRNFGADHEGFWDTVSVAEGKYVRRVQLESEREWPGVEGRSVVECDWPAEPVFAARHSARELVKEDRRPSRSWPMARGATSPEPAAHSELFPGAEWLT